MHEYSRCDTKGESLKDLRKYPAHGSDLLWRPNCVEGGALAGRLIGASLHDALPLQHGLDLCSSRVHTALLLSIILPHKTQSLVHRPRDIIITPFSIFMKIERYMEALGSLLSAS